MQHRIWIRQGEDADYLMKNSDPVSSGGLFSRTKCVPFMPLNLSATTLEAHVDIPGANPASNPGKFADYPTQTGALFQWANIYTGSQFGGGIRWAWSPHTSTQQTWDRNLIPMDFWDQLKVDHETCPPGYRRPTDGSTSAGETAMNISNSELRQSLFQNPKTGWNYGNDIDNSVWGYYADGFFDRRSITNNTTVASGTPEIANAGRLFYNTTSGSDHFNASIFFPATGWLHYYDGSLRWTGQEGLYWTSTVSVFDDFSAAHKITHASALRVFYLLDEHGDPVNHACPWNQEVQSAAAIRCVKSNP